MSARSATLQGRRLVESLMVDTGTITRAGTDTFNPATGLIEPGTGSGVYSGPMRVRQPTATESEILFGEEQLTTSRFVVTVPHDTTGVQIDDIVTIVETDDTDMLARRFRVTGIPMSTFTIYKGFPAEVVE